MVWLVDKQLLCEIVICVIYNDYCFDNVVLDLVDLFIIIGVLDWEMIILGDLLMDFGGVLVYWVQVDDDLVFQLFCCQFMYVLGMFICCEVVDYYGECIGWNVDCFDFYEVFGLFCLQVIVQQIYCCFVLGQISNLQFVGFGDVVKYLVQCCCWCIVVLVF